MAHRTIYHDVLRDSHKEAADVLGKVLHGWMENVYTIGHETRRFHELPKRSNIGVADRKLEVPH